MRPRSASSTPLAEFFGGGVALNWDDDLSRYSWRDVNGDGILGPGPQDRQQQPRRRWRSARAPGCSRRFSTGPWTTSMSPTRSTQASRSASTAATASAAGSTSRSTSARSAPRSRLLPDHQPRRELPEQHQLDRGRSLGRRRGRLRRRASDDGRRSALRAQEQARPHQPAQAGQKPASAARSRSTYERYGNTVDHPDSVWALSQVDVDDGRPGDGADVARSTFDYTGLRYDRLHRESLGFARVDAGERDAGNNDLLRTTRYEYLNDNVFVAGLEKAVTVLDPDGISLRGTTNAWALRDVLNDGTPVAVDLVTGLSSPASLGYSLAPLLRNTRELWHLGDVAATVSEDTRIEFTYDDFGNVLTQRDLGELEDDNDDVLATYVYSLCSNATDPDDPATPENEDIGCNDGTSRPSPLWHDDLCYTWVNLPVKLTITNGKTGVGEVVYRERDGRPAVCNNNSVTHLEETIGDGEAALTELQYDDWGELQPHRLPGGRDGTALRRRVHVRRRPSRRHRRRAGVRSRQRRRRGVPRRRVRHDVAADRRATVERRVRSDLRSRQPARWTRTTSPLTTPTTRSDASRRSATRIQRPMRGSTWSRTSTHPVPPTPMRSHGIATRSTPGRSTRRCSSTASGGSRRPSATPRCSPAPARHPRPDSWSAAASGTTSSVVRMRSSTPASARSPWASSIPRRTPARSRRPSTTCTTCRARSSSRATGRRRSCTTTPRPTSARPSSSRRRAPRRTAAPPSRTPTSASSCLPSTTRRTAPRHSERRTSPMGSDSYAAWSTPPATQPRTPTTCSAGGRRRRLLTAGSSSTASTPKASRSARSRRTCVPAATRSRTAISCSVSPGSTTPGRPRTSRTPTGRPVRPTTGPAASCAPRTARASSPTSTRPQARSSARPPR